MKAFLFGAGSTCGTAGAPIAADFGAELAFLDPDWPVHYPAIHTVVKHLGLPLDRWGLEEVWSCIDFTSKLHRAIPDARNDPGESPQLKKALLKVFGKRLDEFTNRHEVTEEFTLGYLLRREVADDDCLVSFNYDTVMERVAKQSDRRLRVAGIASTDPGAILVKPHGSTSWAMNLSKYTLDWHSSRGGPRLDSLGLEDVDARVEPLLLGTVPIKSELIREVQCVGGFLRIFKTIMQQWRAVVAAVRHADSLIAVGYGFPKEDHYGRFLIEEGLRLRKADKMAAPKVEFYELPKYACKRKAEITGVVSKVFGPHISQPVFRGPVTRPIDT